MPPRRKCGANVSASFDENLTASFNPNVGAVDATGQAITAGRYEVHRGGDIRVGNVVDDPETGDLWITFDGVERPQRVDELSQFCTWHRCME